MAGEVPGLEVTRSELPKLERGFGLGLTPPAKTGPRGRIAAAMGGLGQADFGVPDSQLVERAKGGLASPTARKPAKVVGPVDSPPWFRHLALPITGLAWQGSPVDLANAPHLIFPIIVTIT